MELPTGPPQQSSADVHMQPISPAPAIAKAAPTVPPNDHVMTEVEVASKQLPEEEELEAVADTAAPESAPSTPEYEAPQPRPSRNGKRTKARKPVLPTDSDEDILTEQLHIAPHKAEKNLIDKILRDKRSGENWLYDERAATTKEEDLIKAAKKAAQVVTVHDEEDNEDEQLRKDGEMFLQEGGVVMGEPMVLQRFFIKTARKLSNPTKITDQEAVLLHLERAELRSREFINMLQDDLEIVFPWLFQMMAYSPSELLAIRAFQALQYLFFGFEDEAYVHAPLSGGFLPRHTKARAPYTLSEANGAYLSFGLLEDLLGPYGADFDLSASQQKEVHKPPGVFAPAHNLSLVVRFVSVQALATPCCLGIPQRKEYFVIFCRVLLDPLIAPAVNCVASLQAALEAICDSFSPSEWKQHAPSLALSAKQCVESHILLRDLLRHLHSGERVVEIRSRMCCLHLQPNVSAEIEIRPAAVATAALAEILEQLRTGPPDASVLLTKTLCIDFLADTLVRQLDTQAENIKQVKELLIQVNNKLRDKDSITVSVLKNVLIEFQNRLDLFLRLLTPKLVQLTLDRPIPGEPDEVAEAMHEF